MSAGDVDPLRPELSLHVVGEQGILLDPDAQKIYRFNPVAAHIWHCLERRATPGQIAAVLQRDWHLSPEIAARYVSHALRSWRRLGLLRSGAASRTSPRQATEISPRPSETDGTTRGAGPRAREGARGFTYRVLDSDVTLCLSPARVAREVRAALSGLATVSRSGRSRTVRLRRAADGIRLVEGDRVIAGCANEQEIVPTVRHALVQLALEQADASAALHAAAIRRNGRALVLAGPAATGKSTLAAGLILSGCKPLADDTVVLDENGTALRPLPVPMCIKRGAWPVLGDLAPQLGRLPAYRRADGQEVRYLPAPDGSAGRAGDAVPIGLIVFPRYRANAVLAAERLDAAAGIEAILPLFYPLSNRFDRDILGRLIALVSNVECFRLTYGSLDQAIGAIRGLRC